MQLHQRATAFTSTSSCVASASVCATGPPCNIMRASVRPTTDRRLIAGQQCILTGSMRCCTSLPKAVQMPLQQLCSTALHSAQGTPTCRATVVGLSSRRRRLRPSRASRTLTFSTGVLAMSVLLCRAVRRSFSRATACCSSSTSCAAGIGSQSQNPVCHDLEQGAQHRPVLAEEGVPDSIIDWKL